MDNEFDNTEKLTRSRTHEDVEAHPAMLAQTLSNVPKETNPRVDGLSSDESLSRIPTTQSMKIEPPPDGGWHAWLMAILAHGIMFNTWGFINSFGVFQTYYVHVMEIGGESQISWIGSLLIFIVFLVGTFSGRAFDAGYFRILYYSGSVLYVAGMLLLSLCTTFWQVFLAQCVCVGIGFGLVFVPTLALVSTYFSRNRGLALGVAATGNATGGLVFPAIAERMLATSGFPWTVRVMAFVMAAIAAAGIFMKVSYSIGSILIHLSLKTLIVFTDSSSTSENRSIGRIWCLQRATFHNLSRWWFLFFLECLYWLLLSCHFRTYCYPYISVDQYITVVGIERCATTLSKFNKHASR